MGAGGGERTVNYTQAAAPSSVRSGPEGRLPSNIMCTKQMCTSIVWTSLNISSSCSSFSWHNVPTGTKSVSQQQCSISTSTPQLLTGSFICQWPFCMCLSCGWHDLRSCWILLRLPYRLFGPNILIKINTKYSVNQHIYQVYYTLRESRKSFMKQFQKWAEHYPDFALKLFQRNAEENRLRCILMTVHFEVKSTWETVKRTITQNWTDVL